MRMHWLLALAPLLAAPVFAGEPAESKLNAKAERTAASMRKAILSEIKDFKDHEWAGEYFAGDGLGVNPSIVIAPKAGFVFEWHGCMGLYDRNYGSVTWTNNCIRLNFTFANNRKGFQGTAQEFIPVRWGKRRYLIPNDDIIGFCNNVNEGQEPRESIRGFYLLRRGDEQIDVAGFPEVPTNYHAFLLTEPIHAEILSVGKFSTRPSVCDWKFKDTPVILNVGSNHLVRVGMEFHVTDRLAVESARITKVEGNQCEAVMTQIGEEEPGPETGWRLSTLPDWRKKAKKGGTAVPLKNDP